MRKNILLFGACALLFSACNNTGDKSATTTTTDTTVAVKSGDTASEEPWVPVDSATMMKAMMEYGTPGDMHKMMASWNGTWNDELTTWDYEGAEPKKMKATTVNSMIMGGRYQSSKISGDMMGMPFEGSGMLAFDNSGKKFVSSWIDNWSTGIMMLSGPYDAGAKTITLTGKVPDICRPGKFCDTKEVMTIVDDNTQKMEMYGPDPKTGKQFKMMEIVSTRKK